MKLIDLKCPSCGADLKVNEELHRCTCNYCGHEILIDDEKKEVKITGGYEFGYGQTYGQLQAAYDFNQQHPNEADLEAKKQRVLQTKRICLKKAWQTSSIVALVIFFCVMLSSSKFIIGVISGGIALGVLFIVTYKLYTRYYLGKTEG